MMTDTTPSNVAGGAASSLPVNGGAVAVGARLGAPIRSIGANRRLEPTVAA